MTVFKRAKYLVSTLLVVVFVFSFAEIVYAATFGLTTDDGFTQTNSTDRKYVYSATPASSGTVTAGAARIWNGGTLVTPTHLVIYSDSAGAPNALLAVSDDVSLPTGGVESEIAYTFSGANQISITSGTPYWIGVHFKDPGTGNMNISRANTANLVRSDPDTWSDGSSDPCSCATLSSGGLDVYITFGAAAATASATSSALIKDTTFTVRDATTTFRD